MNLIYFRCVLSLFLIDRRSSLEDEGISHGKGFKARRFGRELGANHEALDRGQVVAGTGCSKLVSEHA